MNQPINEPTRGGGRRPVAHYVGLVVVLAAIALIVVAIV